MHLECAWTWDNIDAWCIIVKDPSVHNYSTCFSNLLSSINDINHIVNGNTALGYVGGQDNLCDPFRHWLKYSTLFLPWDLGVAGEEPILGWAWRRRARRNRMRLFPPINFIDEYDLWQICSWVFSWHFDINFNIFFAEQNYTHCTLLLKTLHFWYWTWPHILM